MKRKQLRQLRDYNQKMALMYWAMIEAGARFPLAALMADGYTDEALRISRIIGSVVG